MLRGSCHRLSMSEITEVSDTHLARKLDSNQEDRWLKLIEHQRFVCERRVRAKSQYKAVYTRHQASESRPDIQYSYTARHVT
jgi:hypothetical protein